MAITLKSPKVNLDLTKQEYAELKAQLASESKTLAAFFTEHAKRYLARHTKKSPLLRVGESNANAD
jgi:hypothetical protein